VQIGDVVNKDSLQIIGSSSSAINTTINIAGTQRVLLNATAENTTVNKNRVMEVLTNSTIKGTKIKSGRRAIKYCNILYDVLFYLPRRDNEFKFRDLSVI
jgi:autotransporter passenger strand-loop-strand repeat protein